MAKLTKKLLKKVGRPKEATSKKTVTMRLRPDLHTKLEVYCKKHGVTRISVVEDLLDLFLK